MIKVFDKWMNKLFMEDESVSLVLILFASILSIYIIGDVLFPIITSLVLAFIVQGIIQTLVENRIPKMISISIGYFLFMVLFVGLIVFILPLIANQLVTLAQEGPTIAKKVQSAFILIPEQTDLITKNQVDEFIRYLNSKIGSTAQFVLSLSLSQVPNLFNWMVNLIIIPILVFFFLKDKDLIINWLSGYLPDRRPVLKAIWVEMNNQMANYVRGKALEILIVGAASYISFRVIGLNYSALLAMLVGLSVLIPFIGATIVTVPVFFAGYLQWGFGGELTVLMTIYLIIQCLDGNFLVPVLFSEVVSLHPVAIITSVLVFGGVWGVWGVFFAIPLATLIKAILYSWPVSVRTE